jgi:hypothetical protein
VQRALRAWHEVNDDPASYLDNWLLAQEKLDQLSEPLTASLRRRVTNDVLAEGLAELDHIDPKGADILRKRYIEQQLGKEVAKALKVSLDQMNRQQAAALRRLTDILVGREQAAREANAQRLEESLPPAQYRALFGFEHLIDRVVGLLEQPDSGDVVVVTGLGGQGKTSLAHAAVSRLTRTTTFADLIWLRAAGEGGTDRPAFDFGAVVTQLLEVLFAGAALPSAPAARVAHLRQALKSRPTLIVLDNLERPDELAALLEQLPVLSAPTRFVLTSRVRPEPGVAAQVVAMSELGRADSVALAIEQAQTPDGDGLHGLTSDDAAAVYDIVGGNPLALKLAVALSAVQPLDGLLADLRSRRTQSVEDLYRHIYWRLWHALSPQAQALLIALPLVSEVGGVTDHLLAISGLTESELWRAIHELWGRSLLEVRGTAREKRYGIHRLTETFVQTDLTGWRLQHPE